MSLSSGSKLQNGDAASENTPLLASAAEGPAIPINDGSVLEHTTAENGPPGHPPVEQHASLPRFQILLLCFARVIEPIAFFGIFPYINQMIQENGELEEADVGFYSGFIVRAYSYPGKTMETHVRGAVADFGLRQEAMFSLTQMLLMISWGRASDRLGRKPVLVFSLSGVAFGTAVFGLSKTIWQMVLFRCFAGVFAGTVVWVDVFGL